MFLKMAPIPEYYPPSAGGSQRDVLGTLLCLRDWPLPTPSAGKYFGKQNAFRPVGANGSALAAASTPHADSGREGLLCNQHLQQAPRPIAMPVKSQSSTARVYS